MWRGAGSWRSGTRQRLRTLAGAFISLGGIFGTVWLAVAIGGWLSTPQVGNTHTRPPLESVGPFQVDTGTNTTALSTPSDAGSVEPSPPAGDRPLSGPKANVPTPPTPPEPEHPSDEDVDVARFIADATRSGGAAIGATLEPIVGQPGMEIGNAISHVGPIVDR